MKLELKHLSAYLPYNVKLKSNDGRLISIMTGINYPYIECTLEHNIANHFSNFSLILRQLSDLTKEIEVNGEKFIPIDKIKAELLGVDWMVFGESEYGWNGFIDKSMRSQINHIPIFMGNEIMGECSYFIYQKLCEWHFDIFGLIDTGLAVDINTVKF